MRFFMSLLAALVCVLAAVESVSAGSTTPLELRARNIITTTPTRKQILDNHDVYHVENTHKHFEGMSLGYVTPWNSHGYTIAKIFASKFTHVAPVWHQIKLSIKTAEKGGIVKKSVLVKLTGGHDVDSKWMDTVRRASSTTPNSKTTRIVPRFILEVSTGELYLKLADSIKTQEMIIKKVIGEVKRRGLDGVTLEMTEAWMVVEQNEPQLRGKLNKFMTDFADALHNSIPDKSTWNIPPSFNDADFGAHPMPAASSSLSLSPSSDPPGGLVTTIMLPAAFSSASSSSDRHTPTSSSVSPSTSLLLPLYSHPSLTSLPLLLSLSSLLDSTLTFVYADVDVLVQRYMQRGAERLLDVEWRVSRKERRESRESREGSASSGKEQKQQNNGSSSAKPFDVIALP